MKIGEAYVTEIQTNRIGDRSDLFRVTASYEWCNILGTITFDAPMSQAKKFYVGQKLALSVEISLEGESNQ